MNTPRGDLNMNLSAPTGFDLQLLRRLAQSFYRHVCFKSHERLTIPNSSPVNFQENTVINPLLSGNVFDIIYVNYLALYRGKESTLAGRYMRRVLLLRIFGQGGLTAMRNRTTLLRAEQSRAEQSRAEQSRAEQSRAWA